MAGRQRIPTDRYKNSQSAAYLDSKRDEKPIAVAASYGELAAELRKRKTVTSARDTRGREEDAHLKA